MISILPRTAASANSGPRQSIPVDTAAVYRAAAFAGSLLLGVLGHAQYATSAPPAARNTFTWPDGKRGAVSLTFDDARLSQVDNGLPLFAKYEVRATFYLSPSSLSRRIEGWKAAVRQGHEMGNHTLNHPCTGNFAFARDKALENYTLATMTRELEDANAVIREYLGVEAASFAYPCGQTFVGRGRQTRSYVPLVAERFRTGRLWLSEDTNDPAFCDPSQLLGMESDGKTFEELLIQVDKAAKAGRWLIFCGHEIASEGRQTTRTDALEQLCRYLKDPANGLWVDTVGTIAEHILTQRTASGPAAAHPMNEHELTTPP